MLGARYFLGERLLRRHRHIRLIRALISLAMLGWAVILPLWFGQADKFVDVTIQALGYVIMALGLNVVVGFAGLLDLGYVAFFAIGAYTAGWLSSGFVSG